MGQFKSFISARFNKGINYFPVIISLNIHLKGTVSILKLMRFTENCQVHPHYIDKTYAQHFTAFRNKMVKFDAFLAFGSLTERISAAAIRLHVAETRNVLRAPPRISRGIDYIRKFPDCHMELSFLTSAEAH